MQVFSGRSLFNWIIPREKVFFLLFITQLLFFAGEAFSSMQLEFAKRTMKIAFMKTKQFQIQFLRLSRLSIHKCQCNLLFTSVHCSQVTVFISQASQFLVSIVIQLNLSQIILSICTLITSYYSPKRYLQSMICKLQP